MAGQLNDLSHSVLALPCGNGFSPASAPNLENLHRHRNAHISHADIHAPIANRIVWNFVRKQRQTVSHTLSPSLNTTERFGIGAQPKSLIQSVNGPILPTVSV